MFVEMEEDNMENEEGMRRFIEAYETMPVLWDSRLTSYKNKNKRREAMVELLSVYQILKPEATMKDLSKKINSMRVNYRKELKKVIASKRSGSDPESIYVPTSWTYNALQFLGDSQIPVDYQINEESEEVAGEAESYTSDTDSNAEHSISSMKSPASNTGYSISSMKTPPVPPGSRKRPVGPVSKQNELLSLACKFLKDANEEDSCKNDQYDDIGKVWAEKLRNLEPRQRIFAEKAINDVLFEASLEQLKKDSVNINKPNTSAQVLIERQQHYSPGYSSMNSMGTNSNNPILSTNVGPNSPPNTQDAPNVRVRQLNTQDIPHVSSIGTYFSTYSDLC